MLRPFTLAALMSFGGILPAQAELLFHPNDPTFTGLGRIIYDSECAACHGANLEGQENWRQRLSNGRLPAPPHDETGHTWHHSERNLFEMTKFGPQRFAGADYQSDMPAYADRLTDAEILAVLSFIKSTWPQEIRDRHDAMSLR